MVLFTDSAEMGSPVRKTQIPCFFRSPAEPRTGRSTMRSSELSNSSESPAASCSSSRTGLGNTTRPALSTVKVVFTMAFYHSYCHNHLASADGAYIVEVFRPYERYGLVMPIGPTRGMPIGHSLVRMRELSRFTASHDNLKESEDRGRVSVGWHISRRNLVFRKPRFSV